MERKSISDLQRVNSINWCLSRFKVGVRWLSFPRRSQTVLLLPPLQAAWLLFKQDLETYWSSTLHIGVNTPKGTSFDTTPESFLLSSIFSACLPSPISGVRFHSSSISSFVTCNKASFSFGSTTMKTFISGVKQAIFQWKVQLGGSIINRMKVRLSGNTSKLIFLPLHCVLSIDKLKKQGLNCNFVFDFFHRRSKWLKSLAVRVWAQRTMWREILIIIGFHWIHS